MRQKEKKREEDFYCGEDNVRNREREGKIKIK